MYFNSTQGELPEAELSDESLAARVAQRDMVAFSLLYDRYARLVYVMAAHLLPRADAEEVTQEIFLRLWDRADQFDPARGAFKSWFLTLARNFVLDELRRAGRDAARTALAHIDSLLADTSALRGDAADEAHANQRRSAILHALDELPAEQRQAIILAYFGGMSQSEIAEELGWPLGTVKKRVRLALQKLRRLLVRWDERVP